MSEKYAYDDFFKRDTPISGESAQLFRSFSKSFHYSLNLNAALLSNLTQRDLIRVIDHFVVARAALVQVLVEKNTPVFLASRLDQGAPLRISKESSDT